MSDRFNCLPINHPDATALVGVVLQAAVAIKKHYEKSAQVHYKPGNEPVTDADREADDIIVSFLKKQFPFDAVLSEENGLFVPDKVNERIWFIDPIDGTKEFIAKNGEFAVQIGLTNSGKLELGVVYQVALDRLYIAAAGQGSWFRSENSSWQQLHVAKNHESLVMAVSRSNPSNVGNEIAQQLGASKIACGSVGLKFMQIAHQKAHFYVNSSNDTKAWDLAAPELLLKEAGGEVTDLSGNEFVYDLKGYVHRNGIFASYNKLLHKQILGLHNNS